MVTTNIFDESSYRKVIRKEKNYSVIEYVQNTTSSSENSHEAYFDSKMNIRKRQLVIQTTDEVGAYVQAGSIQAMMGDVDMTSDVRGAGDLIKKLAGSVVTKESAIKPLYYGSGLILLEPTYNHVLLIDGSEWQDGIVVEDGMFLACDESVEIFVERRNTLSSAVLGGEGLFSSIMKGNGMIALESPVPQDELITVDLCDDVLKIDGDMAIAWSGDLTFSVKKSSSTLIGSAISKEGFVNVYEGTGKVLVSPIGKNKVKKDKGDK